MTVKPLVAAADGSDESLQAIEWAAKEAVLRSAPLRIVAAASRASAAARPPGPARQRLRSRLTREESDRALAAAAARAAEVAPGLQVDTVPLAARRRRRSLKADRRVDAGPRSPRHWRARIDSARIS